MNAQNFVGLCKDSLPPRRQLLSDGNFELWVAEIYIQAGCRGITQKSLQLQAEIKWVAATEAEDTKIYSQNEWQFKDIKFYIL